jgi:hypothetical protein
MNFCLAVLYLFCLKSNGQTAKEKGHIRSQFATPCYERAQHAGAQLAFPALSSRLRVLLLEIFHFPQ